MDDIEKKDWWKKQYTDEELKSFSKDQLLQMMLALPKGSAERDRVANLYNIAHVKETQSWDISRAVETPLESRSGDTKTEEGEPVYNVRRISCVYRGEGGKGFSECLLASSEGDISVKHVDVIGLKPKKVNKMGINPKGMVIDTEPINIHLAGNAIIDFDFRASWKRGNVGDIMMVRDLMSTMEKADLVKLHRFDWSTRNVPEKIKAMFRKKAKGEL